MQKKHTDTHYQIGYQIPFCRIQEPEPKEMYLRASGSHVNDVERALYLGLEGWDSHLYP